MHPFLSVFLNPGICIKRYMLVSADSSSVDKTMSRELKPFLRLDGATNSGRLTNNSELLRRSACKTLMCHIAERFPTHSIIVRPGTVNSISLLLGPDCRALHPAIKDDKCNA